MATIRRYKVRFYRIREKPEDFARYFTLDILGKCDVDVAWKIANVIKNQEAMGSRIHKTRVMGFTEEQEKVKRKR